MAKRQPDSLLDSSGREYSVAEVREMLRKLIHDEYESQSAFAREASSRSGLSVSPVKICDLLAGRSNSFGSAILQMLCLRRKDVPRSSTYVSVDDKELAEV